MSKFYIHNGELFKIEELHSNGLNVFIPKETVTEQIRLYNTVPLFLDAHIACLVSSLQKLHYPLPENFDSERILRYIRRLLNVNKVYKGGVCNLVISFSNHKPEVYLFINALDKLDYEFTTNGLFLAYSTEIQLATPRIHSSYSLQSGNNSLAERILQTTNAHAITIGGQSKNIINTNIGNIIYISNNCIYIIIDIITNPVTKELYRVLQENGYSTEIVTNTTKEILESADEIVILNHIQGISWISRFNESSYGYKFAKRIWHTLVKHIDTYAIQNK